VLGELPEVGVRLAGERAVDPVLAGVVRGERQRPLAVAGAEVTKVARRGLGGALGMDPIVALAVDDEAPLPCRPSAELPEPALAVAAARLDPEAALDHREESEVLGHAVRGQDLAQAREVLLAALEALRRGVPELALRAQPVLPHVDPRMLEARELARRGRRRGGRVGTRGRRDGLRSTRRA